MFFVNCISYEHEWYCLKFTDFVLLFPKSIFIPNSYSSSIWIGKKDDRFFLKRIYNITIKFSFTTSIIMHFFISSIVCNINDWILLYLVYSFKLGKGLTYEWNMYPKNNIIVPFFESFIPIECMTSTTIIIDII